MNNVFDEIINLKKNVVDNVLSNQKLLKLLNYSSLTPFEELDIDNPQSLVDKCIYFKPRAYNTQWNTQAVLMMQMVIVKALNRIDFCDIKLVFTIAVHKDILEIYDNTDRAMLIAKELYDMFHNSSECGIGKMKLGVMGDVSGSTDYSTYEIRFELSSFK